MKNISFRNDVLPLKNKLYRLALRITMNNAEAEDVVQEFKDQLVKQAHKEKQAQPEQQVQLDHKEFRDQLVKQEHQEKQAQPAQPVLLVQLAKLQY